MMKKIDWKSSHSHYSKRGLAKGRFDDLLFITHTVKNADKIDTQIKTNRKTNIVIYTFLCKL